MTSTFFTLDGKSLSPRDIDGLEKYDLLKAVFETVANGQKNGQSTQNAFWFAACCVNDAAKLAGKPAPLNIRPE